jgi:hypothetical protein
MYLHPHDPWVLRQGEDCPVAKMLIERDQNALLLSRDVQNLGVVCSGTACFRNMENIMVVRPERRRHVDTDHLVKIEAHEMFGYPSTATSTSSECSTEDLA